MKTQKQQLNVCYCAGRNREYFGFLCNVAHTRGAASCWYNKEWLAAEADVLTGESIKAELG